VKVLAVAGLKPDSRSLPDVWEKLLLSYAHLNTADICIKGQFRMDVIHK